MARGGRRVGAGRPVGSSKGDGLSTKVVRVSSEVDKLQCETIPELVALLDHWEELVQSNPGQPRYYYLAKALDEIRALGF